MRQQLFTQLFDVIQAKMLLFSTLLAGALAPIIPYFERYVFNDWDFLGFLTSVLVVDTITGVIKHAQKYTLSLNGFMRLFVKMTVILGALIVTHATAHFDPENIEFALYTETVGHAAVMIYVSLSALRNIHELSGGKLPVEWLMRRFENEVKTRAKTRKKPTT